MIMDFNNRTYEYREQLYLAADLATTGRIIHNGYIEPAILKVAMEELTLKKLPLAEWKYQSKENDWIVHTKAHVPHIIQLTNPHQNGFDANIYYADTYSTEYLDTNKPFYIRTHYDYDTIGLQCLPIEPNNPCIALVLECYYQWTIEQGLE